MFGIATPLILAASYLLTSVSQHAGDRQPISSEEFTSEEFGKLVEETNYWCNFATNHEKWYSLEGILDGTKNVVSGITYELHIRQRGTQCTRQEMLERGSNGTGSVCTVQNNESVAVCSVKARQKPWANSTEITVRDIWLVDVIDEFSSETVRQLDILSLSFGWMMRYAKMRLGDHGVDENSYEITTATQSLRQRRGQYARYLEVTMTKMTCRSSDPMITQDSYDVWTECPREIEDEIQCTLKLNEDTYGGPNFTDCKSVPSAFRGAWRSGPHGVLKVSPSCCDFESKCNKSNSPNAEIYAMMNFVRSDVRVLSADEINDTPFQGLLSRVVLEYNRESKLEYIYMFRMVSDVKFQSEPVRRITFLLWLGETSCKKPDANLTFGITLFPNCTNIERELFSGRTEQCEVTVTNIVSGNGINETVAFDRCKTVTNFKKSLLMRKQHVKRGTKSYEISMDIARQAVVRYNSESSDLYEYQLEDIQNVAVANGRLYTMNITIKAVSWKDGTNSTTVKPQMQQYMHCTVSSLIKPGSSNHEVNITGCWRRVTLGLAVTQRTHLPPPSKWMESQQEEILETASSTHSESAEDAQEPDTDYQSDDLEVKIGENEFVSFMQHAEVNRNDHANYQCGVHGLKQKGQLLKRINRTWDKKSSPFVEKIYLSGAPNLLSEDQRFWEFRIKLRDIVREFNSMLNDSFYHRLFRIESSAAKVGGDEVSYTLYLQRTGCLKDKYEPWQPEQEPHVCGKLNITHYTVCTVKMWKMPWGNFTKIDLKKCLLSIVDNPIPVQSISNDFQASAVFKQLFSDASAIYRSESDDRMLYRQQLADHIIRATETPNQIEFNLILSPTNCRKWDDVGHFLRDRQDQCKGVQSPQNFVRCKVNFTESDKEQEMEVRNCDYVYCGSYQPRRPQHAREVATEHFQEVINNAVSLFNNGVDSPYWYNIFTIEDPAIEYMVSCHVRYWQRSWITFHETTDIQDCDLIPIKSTSSNGEQMKVDRKLSEELNMQCVNSREERLVKLFTDQMNLGQQYEVMEVDQVEESPAPGKRLTFTLYFKPKATGQNCSGIDQRTCPPDIHFYVCKGSYWWKDWKPEERLEISLCKKISKPATLNGKTTADSASSNTELKEMISKVLALNDKKPVKVKAFAQKNVQRETEADNKKTLEGDLREKPNSCKGACIQQKSRRQVVKKSGRGNTMKRTAATKTRHRDPAATPKQTANR
ncbi:hypothetical protein CRM22_000138 [Opisthorchis felineus]|uniref:Cystatin domain-containing protein n=1 Tax=Opisthorchis felineus TaxID=147828 RepID=A0A4S2MGF5_OPIFE|nr:hypothetical protein CRM22_000138 [Opisthorchis felineus]